MYCIRCGMQTDNSDAICDFCKNNTNENTETRNGFQTDSYVSEYNNINYKNSYIYPEKEYGFKTTYLVLLILDILFGIAMLVVGIILTVKGANIRSSMYSYSIISEEKNTLITIGTLMIVFAVVTTISDIIFSYRKLSVKLFVNQYSVSGKGALAGSGMVNFNIYYNEISKTYLSSFGSLVIETTKGSKYFCPVNNAVNAMNEIQTKMPDNTMYNSNNTNYNQEQTKDYCFCENCGTKIFVSGKSVAFCGVCGNRVL